MKLYAYAAALLAVIAAGWYWHHVTYKAGYSAAEALYVARSLQVQADAHDRALARDLANQKAAQIAENKYALAIASNADLSHRLDDSLRRYENRLRAERVPEGSGAAGGVAAPSREPGDDRGFAEVAGPALSACLDETSQLENFVNWWHDTHPTGIP